MNIILGIVLIIIGLISFVAGISDHENDKKLMSEGDIIEIVAKALDSGNSDLDVRGLKYVKSIIIRDSWKWKNAYNTSAKNYDRSNQLLDHLGLEYSEKGSIVKKKKKK